jgi:phosphogluconate dehydratase
MGCANVAHAFAAMPVNDKCVRGGRAAPHIGIVTAYNDMLSAHQPYEGYPALIRDEARRRGATVQVAGGVPAMCDGVTQGLPGMELSLFSRDTIAMGTAVALTHDVFDAALLLGVCDKIVPGLLIGALHFGHLPCVFVPAGPMSSGLSNNDKSKVRERPRRAWPGARTAGGRERRLPRRRHLHLLRHRQQQPDAAGGHGPARAGRRLRAPARRPARGADARGGAHAAGHHARRARYTPIGRLVDERVIVNAMVALLATGGSTNHLIHWVAVARAAGILIDWTDFADLSGRAAAGAGVPQRQRRREPVPGRRRPRLRAARTARQPACCTPTWPPWCRAAWRLHRACPPRPAADGAGWPGRLPGTAGDDGGAAPGGAAVLATGGLKLLTGNLGRAVIKTSAVPDDRHIVEAPAIVFDARKRCWPPSRPANSNATWWPWCASRARRPTACPSCTS